MKKQLINLAFIFMAIGLTCLPSFAASPGSLDPSFGVAGVVKTNIFTDDRMSDIAVQADGKIVMVGRASGVNDFTIVRYLANGTLDNSFNGDGIAFVDFGGLEESASAVEIQSDGKIVVAGRLDAINANQGSGVARFNPNGTLDPTFDTDGKLTISTAEINALAIQSDGKIVLAGQFSLDVGVYRLNSDGSTDIVRRTAVEISSEVFDVKLQTDGKILVAGNAALLTSNSKSLVMRYNADGILDTTFSGDGIALDDFSPFQEKLNELVINPITGAITTASSVFPNIRTQLVVRYLSNGNLDNSFSNDGKLETSDPVEGGNDVILQSDGKLICVGNASASSFFVLSRINTNGTLDTSFGINGFAKIRLFNARIQKIALVGDKLIVGTTTGNGVQFDFAVAKINLSNTPTASSDFDGDGVTDVAIYRPSVGQWFVLRSSDNAVLISQFGLNGDVPIDGDFDGDGRNDLAIFRPSSGVWFFQRSSDNTVLGATFGIGTDKPIPGDYDKDGKTDLAVFRPSTGEWFVLRSSSNFATFFGFQFGQNGDIPISSERK